MADTEQKSKLPPWLSGIIDTLVGARLIKQSKIPHRNRLVVILLDSAFETSSRAFLQYKAKIRLQDAHRHREPLVKTVKDQLTDIDKEVWDSLDFYYNEIRCDFYHQSASKTLIDDSLADYQETVEFVIDKALGIRASQLADSAIKALLSQEKPIESLVTSQITPPVTSLKNRVDKVLVAVVSVSPKSYEDVKAFFKREGETVRLSSDDFTNIVARNSGSKRLFYYNKDLRRWELSGLGRFKLKQLQGGRNGA